MTESKSVNEKRMSRLKVAAYIRVSTNMEDQENSYETQERYFSLLLSQNKNWVSAGVYSDYGVSGTSKQNRTGFRRILRHCKEGKIDRIVCKSISRFARNSIDFITALNILNEAEVTIFFEKEGLDTADVTNSFILTTLAAIAQEESRSISTNIRWANEKRFLSGDVRNQDIYGYRYLDQYVVTERGYRYRAVEIVQEEAKIVRWIFEQVAEGRSYKDIARELNFLHIPHKFSAYTRKRMEKSAKGQLNSSIDEGWTDGQIGYIVSNERYTGDVLAQKTYTEDYLTHRIKKNKGEVAQYLVRNHHPAIISRELFEEVRKVRERNSRQNGHTGKKVIDHAFSGRLLCGSCGRFYSVRNMKQNPIWYCPSTTRNNGKIICHNEKVYEEQIIRMLRKGVLQRFHFTLPIIVGDVEVTDIMNRGFMEEDNSFSQEISGFVQQMLARLENIQKMDFVERDRAFIKRQILSAAAVVEGIGEKTRLLESRKSEIYSCQQIMDDASVMVKEIELIDEKIRLEGNKLIVAEKKKKELEQWLECMEHYWEEIERDYEHRERAIVWMKSLPAVGIGAAEFFERMTTDYVRAFVLSITIHNPLHYTVHWFDDTKTEVEMYSNVEDYRYTTVYFDGQSMREKNTKEDVI